MCQSSRYRHILYIYMVTMVACGEKPTNSVIPDEEGAACTSECQAPFMCNEGFCRKMCNGLDDCTKHQSCENNLCQDVPNPHCVNDDECQTPSRCELLSDAYCKGARCYYKPKALR